MRVGVCNLGPGLPIRANENYSRHSLYTAIQIILMLSRIVSMHCPGSHCAGQRFAQASAMCSTSVISQPSARQSPSRFVVRMGSSGNFFVGGNWKSNGTKESVSKLVKELNSSKFPSDVDVIVAPTFVHLPYVVDNIDSRYQVSAQNCWVGKAGAYTGEVRHIHHHIIRSNWEGGVLFLFCRNRLNSFYLLLLQSGNGTRYEVVMGCSGRLPQSTCWTWACSGSSWAIQSDEAFSKRATSSWEIRQPMRSLRA